MLRLGLGPQIASNTPSENSLDTDAQAYFETAGVTDYSAKIQISDFVKEIKNLNLWSNMVCWPLRSTQNVGTGTTAYSLGGLGTYNGTAALDLSGAWHSDGLDLTDSINKALTTSLAANQPVTIFSVNKFLSSTALAYGSSSSVRLRRTSTGTTTAFAGTSATLDSVSADTFISFQVEYNSTNSSSSFNGESKITRNLGTQNISSFIIGSGDVQAGAYISFIALFNSGSIPLIHSIYKSTMGQGLNLQ